jgi:hypothetical protein
MKKVKRISRKLILCNRKEAERYDKRQDKTRKYKKHLLSLYFHEFDPNLYDDMESEYYKNYHNKFINNKIW